MSPLIVRTGAPSRRPGRLAGSFELVTGGTGGVPGTCVADEVRKKGSGWWDWSEKKGVQSSWGSSRSRAIAPCLRKDVELSCHVELEVHQEDPLIKTKQESGLLPQNFPPGIF